MMVLALKFGDPAASGFENGGFAGQRGRTRIAENTQLCQDKSQTDSG